VPMIHKWLDVADSAIDSYKAQQLRGELAVFLAFMDSIKPESVLEIGSADGGLAWAILQIESVKRLMTVDVRKSARYKWLRPEWQHRVCSIIGDSMDSATVDAAGDAADGAYDVVIIDGGHNWENASADWNNYARMARPGGIVMVHDTQGFYNVQGFDVPQLWSCIRAKLETVELVSMRGMQAGTGIVWAGEGDWWDVIGMEQE